MANLQLIKTLAERKNMPITELAEKVGVSEQQIHLMARTNSTKINTLEKIAKVLDVPITCFFDHQPLKIIEKYEAKGKHGIVAKNIGSIDNRDMIDVNQEESKETILEEISEQVVLPLDCPEEAKHLVSKLSLEVELLKKLLASAENRIGDKDERIAELKERIEELKK